jgi:hypothetical protein
MANGTALSNNAVVAGANFCVGQDVRFGLNLPTGVTATNFQWKLDGTFVNDHTNAVPGGAMPNSSDNYFENTNLLSNTTLTNCWWVSGGSSPASNYCASLSCNLSFNNGNTPAPISISGLFTMFRPLPDFSITNMASVSIWTNEFQLLYLGFGTASPNNKGMVASLTNVPVNANGIFYGTYTLVQLVELHAKANYVTGTNVFGWQRDIYGLDNQYPYGGIGVVFPAQLSDNPIWEDSPSIGFIWPERWIYLTNSFHDYLMFQPNGGGIPVPMYSGTWGWSGSAGTTGGLNAHLISTNVQPPTVTPSVTFPVWTYISTNNSPWQVTNLPPFIEN